MTSAVIEISYDFVPTWRDPQPNTPRPAAEPRPSGSAPPRRFPWLAWRSAPPAVAAGFHPVVQVFRPAASSFLWCRSPALPPLHSVVQVSRPAASSFHQSPPATSGLCRADALIGQVASRRGRRLYCDGEQICIGEVEVLPTPMFRRVVKGNRVAARQAGKQLAPPPRPAPRTPTEPRPSGSAPPRRFPWLAWRPAPPAVAAGFHPVVQVSSPAASSFCGAGLPPCHLFISVVQVSRPAASSFLWCRSPDLPPPHFTGRRRRRLDKVPPTPGQVPQGDSTIRRGRGFPPCGAGLPPCHLFISPVAAGGDSTKSCSPAATRAGRVGFGTPVKRWPFQPPPGKIAAPWKAAPHPRPPANGRSAGPGRVWFQSFVLVVYLPVEKSPRRPLPGVEFPTAPPPAIFRSA